MSALHFYAFTTLPARMHPVQARRRLEPPGTFAFTGRRFTFQRRLVTLWAWLMLLPNCGPLPQMSQVRAIKILPIFSGASLQLGTVRWVKRYFTDLRLLRQPLFPGEGVPGVTAASEPLPDRSSISV